MHHMYSLKSETAQKAWWCLQFQGQLNRKEIKIHKLFNPLTFYLGLACLLANVNQLISHQLAIIQF